MSQQKYFNHFPMIPDELNDIIFETEIVGYTEKVVSVIVRDIDFFKIFEF